MIGMAGNKSRLPIEWYGLATSIPGHIRPFQQSARSPWSPWRKYDGQF